MAAIDGAVVTARRSGVSVVPRSRPVSSACVSSRACSASPSAPEQRQSSARFEHGKSQHTERPFDGVWPIVVAEVHTGTASVRRSSNSALCPVGILARNVAMVSALSYSLAFVP